MRTVVVTGGSRGLGQYLVDAFLATGEYNVATCSRHRTPFIDSIEAASTADRFLFREVDISDVVKARQFVAGVRKRFGSVDILINNAAVAIYSVLALQDDSQSDRMVDVNVRGTVAVTRACAREMLKRNWGRIVMLSSITGKTGYRGLSVYAITKAGLEGFARGLARELGDRGVTVNSVAPGFLHTDMTQGLTADQRQQIARRTPAGRLGRCEDVVPLVKFLCSDEAGFISGQTICVDGGLTA
jgi:3-oxoacyl-[acyl-carrier protein] reductase